MDRNDSTKPSSSNPETWTPELVEEYIHHNHEDFFDKEPWCSKIADFGGRTGIYNYLQKITLRPESKEMLDILLKYPGEPIQKYTSLLHIHRATYFRRRDALFIILTKYLNDWMFSSKSRSTPKRADYTRSAIPTPMTSLVGRQKEISQICALLRDSTVRILTLTGPGGTGKTRISLEVAKEVVVDFPDGVFFCSLVGINDISLIGSAIAQSIGLREAGDHDLFYLLQSYLSDKEILLIIDNFEHVVSGAVIIINLLSKAPHTKVLVTSRETLNISGENEFPVPPLGFPSSRSVLDINTIAEYPAIQLFFERSRAVRPDFSLTDENLTDVIEICRRIDGLPLAIELAAVHSKMLAPKALLSRLSSRIEFLKSAKADTHPRQHTVKSTIDWSYDLLDINTRIIFMRLSVFSGTFSINAAEYVCNNDLDINIFDVIKALINKSLLQSISSSDEPLFYFLETIREYALDLLQKGGEESVLRERHANYYLQLSIGLEETPSVKEQYHKIKLINQEHDNLRSALDWTIANRVLSISTRICLSVWKFWVMSGYLSEGRQYLELVLLDSRLHDPDRANILSRAGILAFEQGDYKKSRYCLESAIVIQRTLDDKQEIARSLCSLGQVMYIQGEYEDSLDMLKESLVTYTAIADNSGIATAMHHLGVALSYMDKFDEASKLYNESMSLFATLENNHGVAWSINRLALCEFMSGNIQKSIDSCSQSLNLERMQDIPDKRCIGFSLIVLGLAYMFQGEFDKSIDYQKTSLLHHHEFGNNDGMAWSLLGLGGIAGMKGDIETAACLLGIAMSLWDSTGLPMSPSMLRMYSLQEQALKSQISEELWNNSWRKGQIIASDSQSVVDYALSIR